MAPPLPVLPRLLALAVALGVWAGCARTPTEGLPPGTTLDDLPEGESWSAELRVSEAGSPRLALSAPYLARYRRQDTAYVFLGPPPGSDSLAGRVTVRSYDDGGSLMATVTADRAWYYEGEGRLVAEGRVQAETLGGGGARIAAPRLTTAEGGGFVASGGATVDLQGQAQARVTARRVTGSAGGRRYEAEGRVAVEASGGRRLEAGRVVWDEGAGRFRAPGAFAFTGPGEQVRGVGLVASADLSRYSFRQATGRIEVRE